MLPKSTAFFLSMRSDIDIAYPIKSNVDTKYRLKLTGYKYIIEINKIVPIESLS